jgi:hypothetical protein
MNAIPDLELLKGEGEWHSGVFWRARRRRLTDRVLSQG